MRVLYEKQDPLVASYCRKQKIRKPRRSGLRLPGWQRTDSRIAENPDGLLLVATGEAATISDGLARVNQAFNFYLSRMSHVIRLLPHRNINSCIFIDLPAPGVQHKKTTTHNINRS